MRELPMAGRRGQHRGAVAGQLNRPGQKVGVQMSVGGVGQPQPPPLRGLPQQAQVAAGINRQGAAVGQIDQVGGVAQPLVDQRDHAQIAHQLTSIADTEHTT
jgi:hypothetical protein